MKYNEIYEQVKAELDGALPNGTSYRNGVIAHFFASEKKYRLTNDWLHRALLRDVEDEFITTIEANQIEAIYKKKIAELKEIF